jgi:RNA polymerase sigma-70 factor (ECF subfamily)
MLGFEWDEAPDNDFTPPGMVRLSQTTLSSTNKFLPPRTDIAWLQPFPDRLWEAAGPSEDEPDAVVVARETIELAFLAAIQHLPPRQRAVLILRDVLGWPARQVAALLAEDVRTAMPPYPMWFQGRDAVVAALAASWDAGSPDYVGRFRMVATGANGQPAVAAYVRGPDEAVYRAFAISVLRIEDGRIAEMTAFHDPGLFAAFGLPPTHR